MTIIEYQKYSVMKIVNIVNIVFMVGLLNNEVTTKKDVNLYIILYISSMYTILSQNKM